MEAEEKKGNESEERLKEKSRAISIKEGCAFSVSDGFGLRYITPYALALGASNTIVGFLTSIPSLLGNFSQLQTINAMSKVSRKKLVVLGALAQAIAWLLLILVGVLFFIFHLNSKITPALLIFVYSLLIIFGAMRAPAWNSWMKDLVPRSISGRYFGKRNRLCGLVALICMLAAGFILDYFKHTKIFLGFVMLFAVSFLFRAISSFMLSKKYEPALKLEKEYYFSFRQFLKKMSGNNFGKFVIFVALIQLTTAIASPFFAVYMLKNLGFSYVQYTVVIISSMLFSLLFMPFWGKFADNYGNLKVVKICTAFIIAIPLLWMFSPFIMDAGRHAIVFYLFAIEGLSGIAWAGFNLCSSNFIFDAVTRQRMALCVAYSNILQGIGIFIGATLGGFMASSNIFLLGFSSLFFVFLLSGVARLAVSIILIPRLKEVREVKKFGIMEMKSKMVTFSPGKFIDYLELGTRQKDS
jgi:MFS family permease